MADVSKVKEAVEWYSQNRPFYQVLANKVESIVREILGSEKINYHSVSSRAKELIATKKKLQKKNTKNHVLRLWIWRGFESLLILTLTQGRCLK